MFGRAAILDQMSTSAVLLIHTGALSNANKISPVVSLRLNSQAHILIFISIQREWNSKNRRILGSDKYFVKVASLVQKAKAIMVVKV